MNTLVWFQWADVMMHIQNSNSVLPTTFAMGATPKPIRVMIGHSSAEECQGLALFVLSVFCMISMLGALWEVVA